MDGGAKTPSSKWKVRYGLLLGLERILAEPEPRTEGGTALRRHQIDALAGMLTELIAASQRHDDANGNGNGNAPTAEELAELEVEDEDEDSTLVVDIEDAEISEEPQPQDDPGAIRRYRFRHPTASGKTIAAAGFVEAARTLGVLILTHRRLLVSQFTRDLTTEGYGDRFCDVIETGGKLPKKAPLTIQTYAWFARHVDSISREAYQLVICDEAHRRSGRRRRPRSARSPSPSTSG